MSQQLETCTHCRYSIGIAKEGTEYVHVLTGNVACVPTPYGLAKPTTVATPSKRNSTFTCPTCKLGDQIYENNTLEVRLRVESFDEDTTSPCYGEPENFSYPWVPVDDTLTRVEEGIPRWHCGHCSEDFETLVDNNDELIVGEAQDAG